MTFMDKIPFDQIFQKEWNFNNKYLEMFEIQTKKHAGYFYEQK